MGWQSSRSLFKLHLSVNNWGRKRDVSVWRRSSVSVFFFPFNLHSGSIHGVSEMCIFHDTKPATQQLHSSALGHQERNSSLLTSRQTSPAQSVGDWTHDQLLNYQGRHSNPAAHKRFAHHAGFSVRSCQEEVQFFSF